MANPRRCVALTGSGTQCTRKGDGSPPLCATHARMRDDVVAEQSPLINAVLNHPAIQTLFGRVGQSIDDLAQRIATAGQQKAQPKAEKSAIDPRAVLGFGSTVKLTAELVKERRKKLAALYHPDQGGSEEAMRAINAAADELLKGLE